MEEEIYYPKNHWSQFCQDRYQELEDESPNWDTFDRYKELYALADFWTMFHGSPKFKAKFDGDFEAFGRSMGFDWFFDQTKAPSEFREYANLFESEYFPNNFYTMVPEGYFCLNSGHEAGLSFDDWEIALSGIDDCVAEEARAQYSDRRKRFIELLEQRIEIINRLDRLRISYFPGGRKLIYDPENEYWNCSDWVLCDPEDGSIVARNEPYNRWKKLSQEENEWLDIIMKGDKGIEMEPKHLTSGLQTSIWTVFGAKFETWTQKEERESQSDNEEAETEEAA